MRTGGGRKATSPIKTSRELSPGATRAQVSAFMTNGMSYSAFGFCAAGSHTLQGMGMLLLSPLVSMWLLASNWRVNPRHQLVGGLVSAGVAMIPVIAKSLASAATHSLLGTFLAQSLLIFAMLAACSAVAHGCGTALGELWPMRFNGAIRGSKRAGGTGTEKAKSWQALAAFCDAIEPIVPVIEKLVLAIERVLKVVIVCLAYVLIRWLMR